jgi:hypothetical protein
MRERVQDLIGNRQPEIAITRAHAPSSTEQRATEPSEQVAMPGFIPFA